MDKITSAKDILSKYYNKTITPQDAWYMLSNRSSSRKSAIKYLWVINQWIENNLSENEISKINEDFKSQKLSTTVEKILNSSGNEIYIQKSEILVLLSNLENKTPSDILKLHGYDPLKWELTKHVSKAWNGSSKIQGNYTLFSSSITLSPIQDKVSESNIQEVFEKLSNKNFDKIVKENKNKYKNVKVEDIEKKGEEKTYLLEVPIMDLHLGKTSNLKETGQEYNLEIASNLFLSAIYSLVERAKSEYKHFDTVIFPIGQDFFHIDNEKSQTTKGTQLETDKRWFEIFEKGNEIIIEAIQYLRTVCDKIYIPYIPSNHDLKFSYFLTKSVEAYYRMISDVIIVSDLNYRKYFKFGKNMIGYFHELNNNKIGNIMQAEAPEIWGTTEYRELHGAHLHIEEIKEFPGFKFRRIPSLTATDEWHESKGYVEVQRQAQIFVWEKKLGLIDIKIFNA